MSFLDKINEFFVAKIFWKLILCRQGFAPCLMIFTVSRLCPILLEIQHSIIKSHYLHRYIASTYSATASLYPIFSSVKPDFPLRLPFQFYPQLFCSSTLGPLQYESKHKHFLLSQTGQPENF